MQDILKAYGLIVQIPVGNNDRLAEDVEKEPAPRVPEATQEDERQTERIEYNSDRIDRQSEYIERDRREDQQPSAVQIQPTEPIPVYTATDPIQYLNYGVQGVIFLLVLTFGKPLIDQVSLLFSERARIKASKEDKVLDVQMSASKLVLDQQDRSEAFLQQMIQSQQDRLMGDAILEREVAAKRMEQVFTKLDELTRVARNTNLILREIAALLNYQHRVNTGQSTPLIPELYSEEKELEKAAKESVTLTNPLVLPPDNQNIIPQK